MCRAVCRTGSDGTGEQLGQSGQPVAGREQKAGDAVGEGHALSFEECEYFAQRLVGRQTVRVDQERVLRVVAFAQRGIAGECVEGRGDQRGGEVVEPGVEIRRRAGRMLERCRAQLGTLRAGERGQERGVEVDEAERAVGPDDDVLGFQVAVGAVVGRHGGGEPVERFGQTCELRAVGRCDPLVERLALDPAVDHHVGPFALPVVAVDEEFAAQQLGSVDGFEVARFARVTAQGVTCTAAADFEHHGAVSRAVAHPAVGVAAYVDPAQRARQAAGVADREEILTD